MGDFRNTSQCPQKEKKKKKKKHAHQAVHGDGDVFRGGMQNKQAWAATWINQTGIPPVMGLQMQTSYHDSYVLFFFC